MEFLLRHPVRITITVSHALYDYLGQRSQQEGRSMSNLAAFLLESSMPETAWQDKWPHPLEGVVKDLAA